MSGLRAAAAARKQLHLVGILFPHINDDARSKPHQTALHASCVHRVAEGTQNVTESGFIQIPRKFFCALRQ